MNHTIHLHLCYGCQGTMGASEYPRQCLLNKDHATGYCYWCARIQRKVDAQTFMLLAPALADMSSSHLRCFAEGVDPRIVNI